MVPDRETETNGQPMYGMYAASLSDARPGPLVVPEVGAPAGATIAG